MQNLHLNRSNFYNFHLWVFKNIYDLLYNLLVSNILVKISSFYTILLFLFLTILFCNIVGMVPYSYTITSSFFVTFLVACSFFLTVNFIGFFHNGSRLFQNFLPRGTPFFIAPLLILIENISYISRIFSLSIRLFANMMSGHTLLKILFNFFWQFLFCLKWYTIFAVLPWLIVTIVILLELAIAFLQAYVFIILICIYLNDAINVH